MSDFLDYMDPEPDLETRVNQRAEYLSVGTQRFAEIKAFLEPLKVKDRATYDHSLRVGLLASLLCKFMHLDPKAGLYSGLLHDVGKAQTKLSTLQKTEGWTSADTEEMKSHCIDGYRFLRDKFDFTAEIILYHHRFQPNKYPDVVPEPLHNYCEGTRVMIPMFGRILSLCDVFDALHRVNSQSNNVPLTGERIKELMLERNPDQRILISEAYGAGVFTTAIVGA